MEYNRMRELNVNEIKAVNGGGWFLRFMRPTRMGNGEYYNGGGGLWHDNRYQCIP